MRRRVALTVAGAALGTALFAAGGLGFVRSGTDRDNSAVPGLVGQSSVDVLALAPGASLEELITSLQARVETTPGDYVSWATLGLVFVQQAKVTADPDFYRRAQGALETSLELNGNDNFLVYAGLSALSSARHDFALARDFAQRGLAINEYSAILYGALTDAELQLGNYAAAFDATQAMVDLSPDTASLARASYVRELQGDRDQATQLMQRALDDAPNGAARAFALLHLGELAFDAGDPNAALAYYNAAVEASPDDPAPLAGKAKAEAALGQTQTALDHYAEVARRVPDPSYVVEYGELLESVGRTDEASQQYEVVAATHTLLAAAGVLPDAAPVLFYANHGATDEALAVARRGIEAHPFVAMYDAYAWALHKSGRNREALAAIDEAMTLGTRSALFHYHAGMIKHALGDLEGARTELTTALEINPYFNPLAAATAQATLADLRSEV